MVKPKIVNGTVVILIISIQFVRLTHRDVKLMFENGGVTDEIKRGFLLGLVSTNRPTHEILNPHLLDQRKAFETSLRA